MASEHDNDEQFEKVLHQVHQLLALAEDPGSSTNEAALAFARAQLLIGMRLKIGSCMNLSVALTPLWNAEST